MGYNAAGPGGSSGLQTATGVWTPSAFVLSAAIGSVAPYDASPWQWARIGSVVTLTGGLLVTPSGLAPNNSIGFDTPFTVEASPTLHGLCNASQGPAGTDITTGPGIVLVNGTGDGAVAYFATNFNNSPSPFTLMVSFTYNTVDPFP